MKRNHLIFMILFPILQNPLTAAHNIPRIIPLDTYSDPFLSSCKHLDKDNQAIAPLSQAQMHSQEEESTWAPLLTRLVSLLKSFSTDDQANPSLLGAASHGDKLWLNFLLGKRGAQVNAADPQGRTALFYAAEQGDEETMAFLLLHGASPHVADINGQSILFSLAQNNHCQLIAPLFYQGISLRETMVHAAKNGHEKLLLCLLKLKPNLESHFPFMSIAQEGFVGAIQNNHLKIAEAFLRINVNVDVRDELDRTMLMIAAMQPNKSFVKLLLHYQADVHATTEDTQETPLMFAAQSGNLEIIELLLNQGALVNAANHVHKKTVLMYAVDKGYTDGTEFLLEKGAHVNAATWPCEQTALNIAKRNNHLSMVDLLQRYDAQEATMSWGPAALLCPLIM